MVHAYYTFGYHLQGYNTLFIMTLSCFPGLFPVAFAIVSCENTENWLWFLSKLRDSLIHDKTVYYISDRNAGLLSAFPSVF
ncbi:hypothetical protein ACS0TY_029888 [Phlomoides rotata]